MGGSRRDCSWRSWPGASRAVGRSRGSRLCRTAPKELDEVLCVHLRTFDEHRVTDVGHDGEIAVRYPGRHLFHVLLRDKRVKGAPKHQMPMFNGPLAGTQAAGSPVSVEIGRRSEPDAV